MSAQASREDAARAALRARLGSGARYDAEGAPHADLLSARRGTAYFARLLNGLGDRDLDAAGLDPDRTRRRVVAEIALEARALAHLVAGVRTGTAPAPVFPGEDPAALALAETLPPRALRSLFRHSEVHLNVEWRDLDDAGWRAGVTLPGRTAPVPLSTTPGLRARSVWLEALALGAGGRIADLPPDLRAGAAVLRD